MVTTSQTLKIGQIIQIGQIAAVLTQADNHEAKLSFDLETIRYQELEVLGIDCSHASDQTDAQCYS